VILCGIRLRTLGAGAALAASAGAVLEPPPAPAPPPASAPAPPSQPAARLDVQPPTGIDDELHAITPGVAMKREFDRIAEKTNIRFGVANTFLLQQASGGPGRRTAASGDLDLLAKWTAVGAGTKDTGVLAFAAEYRYQIGDITPSALGGEIGTLVPTTNSFSERPMVVKEVYWDQRLADDHIRIAAGRIDPENLFGGHRLQSANTFFFNKAFSGNVSVAYPGPGLALAGQIKPVDWFYLTAGITDANGSATIGNFQGVFDDLEFLYFTEAAILTDFKDLGQGRYRLALWHIDERDYAGKPSDAGFTISADQDFGKSVTVFARYGHADADVTNITDSAQLGAGIKSVLTQDDLLGAAVAWSSPKTDSKRDEKVLEFFDRLQITETSQFTLGVELIFDPSNAPDDDLLGVFSARLRIAF
jgi:hypothetical protein